MKVASQLSLPDTKKELQEPDPPDREKEREREINNKIEPEPGVEVAY